MAVQRSNPDKRVEPDTLADERTMLEGWLDFHREILFWKCDDLTDEQLKTASVEPSELTLIGLVRHMAEVERGWFAPLVGTDTDLALLHRGRPRRRLRQRRRLRRRRRLHDAAAEIDLYNAEAQRFSLDDRRSGREQEINLRWIYTHMIEEYARHNGHADLLRERLDGVTGDW